MKRWIFLLAVLSSCSLLVFLTNAKKCRGAQDTTCDGAALVRCIGGFEERITCASAETCSAQDGRCGVCGDGILEPGELCFDAVAASSSVLVHPSTDFVIADFDLNGDADIVSVGSNGVNSSFQLLKGIGNGGFTVGPNNANMPVNRAFQLRSLDLNNDSSPDLVWSNTGEGIVRSALSGANDFNSVQADNNQQSLACKGFDLGDMDGDSLLDIIVASEVSDSFAIFLASLDPNDRFQEETVIFPVNTFAKGRFLVGASDWNNDGTLDLVFATPNELQFMSQVPVSNGFSFDVFDVFTLENPSFMEVVDIDMDGDDDVFIAQGSDVIQFLNDGDSGFDRTTLDVGPDLISFMSFDDADKDGDKDLLLAFGEANRVEVYNNEGGSLRPALSLSVPGFPAVVRLGRINDDDDFLDLVVAGQLSSDLSVFLANP